MLRISQPSTIRTTVTRKKKKDLTQESSLIESFVMFLAVLMLQLGRYLKNGPNGLLRMEQHFIICNSASSLEDFNFSK